MLSEFMNNNSASEITKKIFRVNGQGAITDHKIRNWLSKFLVEYNSSRCTQELVLDLSTSQYTICQHLREHPDGHQKLIKMF